MSHSQGDWSRFKGVISTGFRQGESAASIGSRPIDERFSLSSNWSVMKRPVYCVASPAAFSNDRRGSEAIGASLNAVPKHGLLHLRAIGEFHDSQKSLMLEGL